MTSEAPLPPNELLLADIRQPNPNKTQHGSYKVRQRKKSSTPHKNKATSSGRRIEAGQHKDTGCRRAGEVIAIKFPFETNRS